MEVGRGAQASAEVDAAAESAVTVKEPVAARGLAEVCPAPGSAEGFPGLGPRGNTST